MFHVEQTELAPDTQCPVCSSYDLNERMVCHDHLVSGEDFNIIECHSCDVWFTWPQPDKEKVGSYYKSDEYISHSNTGKGVFNKAYQIVRRYAINRKYNLIKRYKQGSTLLDIGCGTGHFLDAFAKKGWEVKGIEPGEKPREYAQTIFGLDVKDEDELNKYSYKTFDVITMWHVLEHVHDINERLNQVRRLLKDDGLAVIALPNRDSWDASHYKSLWAAWDVPRHLYHFNSEAFIKLSEKSGLKMFKKVPMPFDAFYVSMLSEEHRHNRKNMLNAIAKGMISNTKALFSSNYSSLIYLLKKSS